MNKLNKSFTLISKGRQAFTLIELLVVISIIGILLGLSIFGMKGSREYSRDGKRKADLELIRSGLELYRSDCGFYPGSLTFPLPGPTPAGVPLPSGCSSSNTYINSYPYDPLGYDYVYSRVTATSYTLCARLEQGSGSVSCNGITNCGSGSGTCNYKVTNP